MYWAVLGLVFASCKTSIHHIPVNKGRFKSQALLNEQALLSCMAYVDLNPIRAGISESLDSSEFTSIKQRIKDNGECLMVNGELEKKVQEKKNKQGQKSIKLADFVGGQQTKGIPFTFMDYLELADWTGRTTRNDKKGAISEKEPKILEKLGIDSDIWLKTVHQFSDRLYSHLGTEEQIKVICEQSGKKWLPGIRSCRLLF